MAKKSLKSVILVFVLTAAMVLTSCAGSSEGSTQKEEAQAAENEAAADASAAENEEAESEGGADLTETDQDAAEEQAETAAEELITPAPIEDDAQDVQAEPSADDEEAAGEVTEKTGGAALSLRIGSRTLAKYDDSDYEELCEVTYPQVMLCNDDEVFCDSLENALEKRNAEWQRYAENTFGQFSEESVSMKAEQGEYFGYYTDEETLYCARADEAILSLGSTYFMYTGGAHGMHGFKAYNYDPETGKSVSIREITTDLTALVKLLTDDIKEKYPDLSLMDDIDLMSEGYVDSLVWTMGYDGIRFFFDPYLLGSYAEGAQRIFIPFAGNEELFKEKYLQVPEAWGIGMPENELDLDIDGDGEAVNLRIDAEKDDDSIQIEKLTITYGDETFWEGDIWAYDFVPTLIKNENGLFLYLELLYDNDYRGTQIFELTSGEPSFVTDIPLHRNFYYDEESGIGYRDEITDPVYTCLAAHTDLLSTMDGWAYFTVAEDGVPDPEHPWYELSSTIDLTLKQDLSAETVNEDGEENGSITVPSGSVLTIFRTDNVSWTDAYDEEGNIVRITLDSDEWPRTVGGMELEDIFDGMIFAG